MRRRARRGAIPIPALLAAALLVSALGAAAQQAPVPLPRSAPEAQGVSSAGVLAFLESGLPADGLHSFMLVRHGHVVAEGWWAPYDRASNHELYSLSKSFTSTAVGLAIAEGRFGLDDPVLDFFPEDAPAEPSANLKAMRVRDLLRMSAGHQDESATAPDKISVKAFLEHPVPHKPGTHFKYNTPATFMLSAIVQKRTGQTVVDYLRPRLFEPLGIEHPYWATNTQGISLGGYGLRVRTEDIARFGQLYLEKGSWRGKQLVPAEWIAEATATQIPNGSDPTSDWEQGYGYQFWRSRHASYRADGAFGQYCLVLPEQDAVIVFTSGLKDMQGMLNQAWDKLLPALQARPLPVDPAARQSLERKLASLSLATPEGAATSPLAAKVVGREFVFPANDQKLESVALERDPSGDGLVLVWRRNDVVSRISVGYQKWTKGRASFEGRPNEPVAASGAWQSDDTYLVKLYATELPHALTITLRFGGDLLIYDAEANVAFGPTKQQQLIGTAR
jgi:CubicO group peptidase (beta-lactamase class C family)